MINSIAGMTLEHFTLLGMHIVLFLAGSGRADEKIDWHDESVTYFENFLHKVGEGDISAYFIEADTRTRDDGCRHAFDRPGYLESLSLPEHEEVQVLSKKPKRSRGRDKYLCAWWHPQHGLLIGHVKSSNLVFKDINSSRGLKCGTVDSIVLPTKKSIIYPSVHIRMKIRSHTLALWEKGDKDNPLPNDIMDWKFDLILFGYLWNSKPLPRRYRNPNGKPLEQCDPKYNGARDKAIKLRDRLLKKMQTSERKVHDDIPATWKRGDHVQFKHAGCWRIGTIAERYIQNTDGDWLKIDGDWLKIDGDWLKIHYNVPTDRSYADEVCVPIEHARPLITENGFLTSGREIWTTDDLVEIKSPKSPNDWCNGVIKTISDGFLEFSYANGDRCPLKISREESYRWNNNVVRPIQERRLTGLRKWNIGDLVEVSERVAVSRLSERWYEGWIRKMDRKKGICVEFPQCCKGDIIRRRKRWIKESRTSKVRKVENPNIESQPQNGLVNKFVSSDHNPVDLPQKRWKKGDQVNVFSETFHCWCRGSIDDIYDDTDGKWLAVNYMYERDGSWWNKDVLYSDSWIKPLPTKATMCGASTLRDPHQYPTDLDGGSPDLPDNLRKEWKVHDMVEVFSTSANKWIKAQIIHITEDHEGEWLVVEYEVRGNRMGKEVQRMDKRVRPCAESGLSDAEDSCTSSAGYTDTPAAVIEQNDKCCPTSGLDWDGQIAPDTVDSDGETTDSQDQLLREKWQQYHFVEIFSAGKWIEGQIRDIEGEWLTVGGYDREKEMKVHRKDTKRVRPRAEYAEDYIAGHNNTPVGDASWSNFPKPSGWQKSSSFFTKKRRLTESERVLGRLMDEIDFQKSKRNP